MNRLAPPPGSRMPAGLLNALRVFVTLEPGAQDSANELLSFAIAACVAGSLGTADDALTIYQDVIASLNLIVERNTQPKDPPS